DVLGAVLERGVERGVLAARSPRGLAVILAGMVHAVIRRWLREKSLDLGAEGDALVELFLHGAADARPAGRRSRGARPRSPRGRPAGGGGRPTGRPLRSWPPARSAPSCWPGSSTGGRGGGTAGLTSRRTTLTSRDTSRRSAPGCRPTWPKSSSRTTRT